MDTTIRSERLDLISMTPAFLRASLARNHREAEVAIGLSLPPDWPEDGCRNVLSLRLQQIENDATFQPWSLRAMALRNDGTMVGHIGFHTRPGPKYCESYAPGAVEYGFSVFPAFRRRGFAREAAIALMSWAQERSGVTKFVLTIRPDNWPSQQLAEQLGFVRIGSHIDDVDGLEEILLRDLSNPGP